jgi:FdhD protein
MSLAKSTRPVSLARFDGATTPESCDDALAVEEPLELRVGGRTIAVTMRTPGHDRELAAGFLVTEGVVRRRDDVLDVVYCRRDGGEPNENVIDVLLAPGVAVDWGRLTRHVFTASSCGVCGKASIEAVQTQFPPIVPGRDERPSAAWLATLPERLRKAQVAFDATGGLHACALFEAAGDRQVVREDVGRHNAVDKVIGHAFFAETLPLAGRTLLVSGRVSFEIVQKALAAGVPCVAAVSAPTSAAVDLARASGMTLVGFLRGTRMNVYAGTLAG